MLRNSLSLLTALIVALCAFSSSGLAQAGIALAPGYLVKINKANCGYINGRWTPGSVLRTGNFLTTSSKISSLNKQLKKKGISSSKKSKLLKKRAKQKQALRKNSRVCNSIGAPVPSIAPTPIATPASPLPGAVTVAWSESATSIANDLGGEYLYFCPPNPTESLRAIYGHDTYTSDSPICVAALHLGLFKRGIGGNVRFRIKGSQSFYYGSNRNGVQSNFYGVWATSYSFIDLASGTELITNTVPEISWVQTATPFYTYIEQQFTLYCPPGIGQSTKSVYGTDLYTYDSSICNAAVHAGRISLANGGVVIVQIKPGSPNYLASFRNGVSSLSYGSWGGSFIFVP